MNIAQRITNAYKAKRVINLIVLLCSAITIIYSFFSLESRIWVIFFLIYVLWTAFITITKEPENPNVWYWRVKQILALRKDGKYITYDRIAKPIRVDLWDLKTNSSTKRNEPLYFYVVLYNLLNSGLSVEVNSVTILVIQDLLTKFKRKCEDKNMKPNSTLFLEYIRIYRKESSIKDFDFTEFQLKVEDIIKKSFIYEQEK